MTRPGIEGGLVHIANHAFSKITLFFCAGAIYVATHKKNISEMNGLGRVMPWTFGAFAIASLSMIGAPPVAGFVSKWYLLNGAFDAGSVGIIIVLLVSTVLNAAYFAPVVYAGFFGKTSAEDTQHKYTEAHPALVIPLTITAAISLVIGLYPGFFMSFVHAVLP
jgi:multicomponent Na+:H+ antiporter subunit D